MIRRENVPGREPSVNRGTELKSITCSGKREMSYLEG
jgi:hypothetical protein